MLESALGKSLGPAGINSSAFGFIGQKVLGRATGTDRRGAGTGRVVIVMRSGGTT